MPFPAAGQRLLTEGGWSLLGERRAQQQPSPGPSCRPREEAGEMGVSGKPVPPTQHPSPGAVPRMPLAHPPIHDGSAGPWESSGVFAPTGSRARVPTFPSMRVGPSGRAGAGRSVPDWVMVRGKQVPAANLGLVGFSCQDHVMYLLPGLLSTLFSWLGGLHAGALSWGLILQCLHPACGSSGLRFPGGSPDLHQAE